MEFINEGKGARLRVFAALKHHFMQQACTFAHHMSLELPLKSYRRDGMRRLYHGLEKTLIGLNIFYRDSNAWPEKKPAEPGGCIVLVR